MCNITDAKTRRIKIQKQQCSNRPVHARAIPARWKFKFINQLDLTTHIQQSRMQANGQTAITD